MKRPKPTCRPERQRAARIESDTPIVPRLIMEAVCEEAAVWLGQPLPRRWARELTARANTIYARNPSFRRKVKASGDLGRDYLWTFARHWLAGLIHEHRPRVYMRLPDSFKTGQPLPAKPPAPPLRMATMSRPQPAVRPAPRRRLTADHAFAAAAHFAYP